MDTDSNNQQEFFDCVKSPYMHKFMLQNILQRTFVFQSVFLGIKITGCHTPKVSGAETKLDCRMEIERLSW